MAVPVTAPRHQRGSDANTRGVIVLVVAVVVGFLLLFKVGGGTSTKGDASKSNKSTSTSTSTTLATTPSSQVSTTAPTGSAHLPSTVKVSVQNGNGTKGLAATNVAKLKAKGYTGAVAGSAAPTAKSVVYAAPDYQADATAIATALGLPPTVVAPMPTPPPAGAADAKVVVVLGKDAPTG